MSKIIATSVAVEDLPPLHDIAGADGMLFVHGNVGIATKGAFARVEPAKVHALLSSIEHRYADEHDAAGPVALGFLPFLREEHEDLFVPSVFARRFSDGYSSITICTDAQMPEDARSTYIEEVITSITASLPTHACEQSGEGQLTNTPLTPINTYLAAVSEARSAVRSGHIEKAVIARDIELASDTPLNIHSVVQFLHNQYGAFLYLLFGDLTLLLSFKFDKSH
jgi:isochorismate synthase EntC